MYGAKYPAKTTLGVKQELAEARAEIERLRQQVAQRGARMQVMREWMTQAEREDWSMIISTDRLYEWFLYAYPEAADWFDADGVPF